MPSTSAPGRGLLLLAAALIPFGACQPPPPPPPVTRPPADLLLVVADTLRADELGAYGSPQPITPHLDRLSRRGTTYSNVRSSAPWTLPAMASAFSGLRPTQTGVMGQLDTVATGVRLVSEDLQASGYDSAAVSSNYLYVSPKAGLGRGFARFEVLVETEEGAIETGEGISPFEAFGAKVKPAPVHEVVRRAREIWSQQRQPRFLYLHLMDTHWPYRSDEPSVQEPPEGTTPLHLTAIDFGKRKPRPVDARFARTLYRAALRSLDRGMGRLVATVKPEALRLVFTSDHGEEFLEHDGMFHGHSLYDELLRVPAIVVEPDTPPQIDDAPRSLLGLQRLLRDGAWPPEPQPYAERLNRGQQRSIVSPPWKLFSGDRGECWIDLRQDPAERWDAGPPPEPTAEAIRRGLQPNLVRPRSQGLAASEEELRSLGYLP